MPLPTAINSLNLSREVAPSQVLLPGFQELAFGLVPYGLAAFPFLSSCGETLQWPKGFHQGVSPEFVFSNGAGQRVR